MNDEAWLLDILNAAVKIQDFTAGLDKLAFQASELHQSAVVKQFEVIGEAASRVSQEFRNAHAELPWKQIVGMRHRLVHDYANIKVDTLWHTVQNDINPLISRLRPLVTEEDAADETNGV